MPSLLRLLPPSALVVLGTFVFGSYLCRLEDAEIEASAGEPDGHAPEPGSNPHWRAQPLVGSCPDCAAGSRDVEPAGLRRDNSLLRAALAGGLGGTRAAPSHALHRAPLTGVSRRAR